MSKGIFKKIAESKSNGTGRPLEPARYGKLAVSKCFIHEGFKGASFIAEFIVREMTPTGEIDRKTGKPCLPVEVGSMASFVVNLDNPNAKGAQFSNVKRFILALFGKEESEVSNEEFMDTLEDLCGEGTLETQPVRGRLISCETFKKPKASKPEEDFTHHRWSHVSQTDEEILAERKALDAAKQ